MSNHHSVTVTTRLEDEGTDDERRCVDTVKFECTAPDNADCRNYPKCDCESFEWNDAETHDTSGHKRVPGRPCWLTDWFDAPAVVYAGVDADDMRDDYAAAVDRTGPITHEFMYGEYVEWDWAGEGDR